MKQGLSLIFLMVLALTAKAQNSATMTINQEAPVIQKRSIHIEASPEKVWEVLSEIENWTAWNDKIKQAKIEGTAARGKTFTWKTNGTKIKSKIHTFHPYQTLGWKGKAFGAKAIHNWYLESTETGTQVFVEESMEGWLIGLMKKKMNKTLGEDMDYWLAQLKKESER